MADLSRELRRSLENTIKAARVAAEVGAGEALRRLGVAAAELPAHLISRRAERNRLRAHARSLGDRLNRDETQEIRRLTEAAAYVQWHRLLFARFLMERGLLRDQAGVPLSLADCREEATIKGAGEEWSVAAAHASRLLPGVFPPDDPVESLILAPEHAKALRDHLRSLDGQIFVADDSLGWTYQFWRAAEKKAVNESQVKIGAAELPAVTQLFTEPYMVRFLLHNTLGAWWAGKVLSARPNLARDAANEPSLRSACALPGYEWDCLRFVRENEVWRPAAGSFPSWPRRAAEITLLDPCCGSGHFLTEALAALAALRGAEETLSPADAIVAALRDNLHGLEIDGRCVQIAAFALALTAWRIGGAEIKLPTPHVAWVGAPPPLPESEFAALANGDVDLRRGLRALHDLFAQAPLLGSLIEVTGGDLVNPVRIARIEESIVTLVERIRDAEPERAEGALAARGMADAAAILAKRFVLHATNVPFLARGKQESALADFIASHFPTAKTDLATAMVERMFLAASRGAIAAVTPLNWLQLDSYEEFRLAVLQRASCNMIASLGAKAFSSGSTWDLNIALVIWTASEPSSSHEFATIDVADIRTAEQKAGALIDRHFFVQEQATQARSSGARINLQPASEGSQLKDYADYRNGLQTGDYRRFGQKFWEQRVISSEWAFFQTTIQSTCDFDGLHGIVKWENGEGALASSSSAVIRGTQAWGRRGVAVSAMGRLACSRYEGALYDDNTVTLIPKEPKNLSAIWACCSSPRPRPRPVQPTS